MDPFSYPLPIFDVDSTSTYSGYYPSTDYWNWVNYYYQNGFTYDQPTSSGYSFMTSPSTSTMSTSSASDPTFLSMTPRMPTSTFATPSTSSTSSSTATPYPMLSMTPPFCPMAPTSAMTPATTATTPHRPQDAPKQCSNCFATETCQWRNVRSENGILCNACFIYQRKYKKTRPVTAMEKYRSKKAQRQSNSD